MQQILEQLNRVRGVGGCLLLSNDGLPMASALRSDIDETVLAAALASVVEQASRLCEKIGLGRNRLVQTLGAQGGILLLAAGPGFLGILMDPSANLALLQLEARPFAERIAQRLTL